MVFIAWTPPSHTGGGGGGGVNFPKYGCVREMRNLCLKMGNERNRAGGGGGFGATFEMGKIDKSSVLFVVWLVVFCKKIEAEELLS